MAKSLSWAVYLMLFFSVIGSNVASADSLSAALGATKLDGLANLSNCMNETTGYHERLIADRLELKLANTPGLSPAERSQWFADIQSLRQVQITRKPYSPPNPGDPQHYLLGLTDQEQVAINSMNSRFAQEVNLKCEQKFGGMTRYAGSNVPSATQIAYENQLRAQMGRPINVDLIPITPLPSPVRKTPAQLAEAKRNAQQAIREQAAALANECMGQMKGLRSKLVAQALQRKLDSGTRLSAKERAEFQADIQAAWASAGKGLDQIEAVDPKNPYRAERHMSPQDQIEINNEYSKQSLQLVQNCTAARRNY